MMLIQDSTVNSEWQVQKIWSRELPMYPLLLLYYIMLCYAIVDSFVVPLKTAKNTRILKIYFSSGRDYCIPMQNPRVWCESLTS